MPPSLRTPSANCVLRPLQSTPSSSHLCPTQCLRIQRRDASAIVPARQTRMRARMWAWLHGPGANFRDPLPGSTNYLGAYDNKGRLNREKYKAEPSASEAGATVKAAEVNDPEKDASATQTEEARKDAADQSEAEQRPGSLIKETASDLRPFPLNPFFQSQPVLSDELKDEIYIRIQQRRQTVREVSQALHVEMRRVAAVVRLKTVEENWKKDNKSLATVYAREVGAMLPKTTYDRNSPRNPWHESINDLPVHEATLTQLFHPTSESRQFTRADAGRAFARDLMPADERIPHPDMIESERDAMAGMSYGERAARRQERANAEKRADAERKERQRVRDQREKTVVPGKRWDFVFREMRVEQTGRDGRGGDVGWRYGMPLDDRKKGKVKIPTKVE